MQVREYLLARTMRLCIQGNLCKGHLGAIMVEVGLAILAADLSPLSALHKLGRDWDWLRCCCAAIAAEVLGLSPCGLLGERVKVVHLRGGYVGSHGPTTAAIASLLPKALSDNEGTVAGAAVYIIATTGQQTHER